MATTLSPRTTPSGRSRPERTRRLVELRTSSSRVAQRSFSRQALRFTQALHHFQLAAVRLFTFSAAAMNAPQWQRFAS